MNPPSIILGGGGVHYKACWLIVYSDDMSCMAQIYKVTVRKTMRDFMWPCKQAIENYDTDTYTDNNTIFLQFNDKQNNQCSLLVSFIHIVLQCD